MNRRLDRRGAGGRDLGWTAPPGLEQLRHLGVPAIPSHGDQILTFEPHPPRVRARIEQHTQGTHMPFANREVNRLGVPVLGSKKVRVPLEHRAERRHVTVASGGHRVPDVAPPTRPRSVRLFEGQRRWSNHGPYRVEQWLDPTSTREPPRLAADPVDGPPQVMRHTLTGSWAPGSRRVSARDTSGRSASARRRIITL